MGVHWAYSIDVGLHGLGIGAFTLEPTPELQVGWYQPFTSLKGRGAGFWAAASRELEYPYPPTRVLIETMQVYRGVKGWHVDPDDLLELQGLAGAIAANAYSQGAKRVDSYLPKQWKGQVPKAIMHARIQTWLQERGWAHRLIAPKPSRRLSDLLDGVGLGMVALGLNGVLKAKAEGF